MRWTAKNLVIAALALGGAAGSASAQSSDPTCSETLGIEVHGQHVIGDYVTGLHGDLGWPPEGSEIGRAVAENRGVVTRGGPGPGFHFPNDFAPGASFCTDSASPGLHL
jgi:hypothetical protein